MDPATEEPTPPSADDLLPPARRVLPSLAAFLARRGLTPRTLAVSGLAFCTLASLCYVVRHPGLAGVLGLVGLLLGEIARAPAGEKDPLVGGFNLLSDLAIAAGFVAAAALDASGICVLLGLLALILLAWLPYLEALPSGGLASGGLASGGLASGGLASGGLASGGLAPAGRVPGDLVPGGSAPAARTFWRRPERLTVLLVGGLLAAPVVPLLLVVVAGIADAWLAIGRLSRIGRPPRTRPAFLDALLRADGSIQPLLRWGSLLIALLLLVVLPRGEGWRF